jgi:hypothetical protein
MRLNSGSAVVTSVAQPAQGGKCPFNVMMCVVKQKFHTWHKLACVCVHGGGLMQALHVGQATSGWVVDCLCGCGCAAGCSSSRVVCCAAISGKQLCRQASEGCRCLVQLPYHTTAACGQSRTLQCCLYHGLATYHRQVNLAWCGECFRLNDHWLLLWGCCTACHRGTCVVVCCCVCGFAGQLVCVTQCQGVVPDSHWMHALGCVLMWRGKFS